MWKATSFLIPDKKVLEDSTIPLIVQALISVGALVFDLEQLTYQKRFDCKNAILRSSAILLGTSYSQIVVAVWL